MYIETVRIDTAITLNDTRINAQENKADHHSTFNVNATALHTVSQCLQCITIFRLYMIRERHYTKCGLRNMYCSTTFHGNVGWAVSVNAEKRLNVLTKPCSLSPICKFPINIQLNGFPFHYLAVSFTKSIRKS